jgi:cell wall-associated NlpC family hydrolase
VYPSYQRPAGGRVARRLAVLAVTVSALAAATVTVLATVIDSTGGGGTAAAALIAYAASTQSACVPPAAAQGNWSQWSATQVTNAATIARTGQADHVPLYGQVIAVATAMQESDLVNLSNGDRDSVGLFQQRPSQGWGTPAQIMDPVYAAGQFYSHLLAVPGWQDLPLTVAAQDVQNSGYPGAYAKWQADAADLVAHVTGGGNGTVAGSGPATTTCGPGTVPAGTPAKVAAVITWAEQAEGTLYDYGGSCTSPHSTDMALHCDCSSLVQMAFKNGAGLSLPRTAEAQWEYGEAGHAQVIPLNDAQPGDVVYFPSYLGKNTIGHTGIVTNPKTTTMINAPETGKPVGFASYAPAGLPYGTHLFTILRFITTTGSKA